MTWYEKIAEGIAGKPLEIGKVGWRVRQEWGVLNDNWAGQLTDSLSTGVAEGRYVTGFMYPRAN